MSAAEIKVVLVTMFQPGGERPGELTHWREGLGLKPWTLDGFAPETLWQNGDGVAALVTGVGPVNTALAVQALGLAADCRNAHWLVCGVAGGNPERCSLGSPVWADWVVDGDLAFDFHPADAPPDWDTGILPLGGRRPYDRSGYDESLFGNQYQVFQIDPDLVAWAAQLSAPVALADTSALAAARKKYARFARGAAAPATGCGACLSAARFWHGARHHAWAERWVAMWTEGRGAFTTSSMEDSGTLAALAWLGRAGRADTRRALVLRSVSNYTLPAPGAAAHSHLAGEGESGADFPGLEPALENAWRTARVVVRAWLDD